MLAQQGISSAGHQSLVWCICQCSTTTHIMLADHPKQKGTPAVEAHFMSSAVQQPQCLGQVLS